MKYGALGSIIGHEITHAFDQRGMQFDSEGLRNELWSFTDAESVKDEQQCLINQYNGFGHQNFKVMIWFLNVIYRLKDFLTIEKNVK